MAQASLNPGVGTFVKDMLAPELQDGSNVTATANGAWVEVNRVWECVVVLETGTVTGTTVVCDVAIVAADDSSGTNPVTIGEFVTLAEGDDDVTKFLYARITKPWVRAEYTVSGSSPVVPLTITVRDTDYHLDEDNSA
jgi:hypothetical protein